MPVKRRNRKTLRTREHTALISVIVASRHELGLTQQQLANRVATIMEHSKADRSWLAKFEAGERRLDVVELMWIERAMKMDPGMLVVRTSKWLETPGHATRKRSGDR